MGLDVFFYKKPNIEPPKPSCDEILAKLSTENKELERALQRLCEYADHFNETVEEQLVEAINEYVGSYDVNDDKDELAFLCKNWWIVETLNYTEGGKNMRLNREDIEKLRDKAMNAIRDTLSHLSLNLDNYDDIYEYINTNIHSGFIRVEAVIVGPQSIIPVFTCDEGDTVLCRTKILETRK